MFDAKNNAKPYVVKKDPESGLFFAEFVNQQSKETS